VIAEKNPVAFFLTTIRVLKILKVLSSIAKVAIFPLESVEKSWRSGDTMAYKNEIYISMIIVQETLSWSKNINTTVM